VLYFDVRNDLVVVNEHEKIVAQYKYKI